MSDYVVVTRTDPPVPERRFHSVEVAAEYIVERAAFGQMEVVAHDDGAPPFGFRPLDASEKGRLEAVLMRTLDLPDE